MPTPASPYPRESKICTKSPPKEWPMIIGGEGNALMIDA